MERRKKKENSGFYIALCCCAVIIAAVGYAGRLSMVEENEPEITGVVEATQVPKIPEEKKEETPVREAKENVEVNNNVVIDEPLTFGMPVDGKVLAEFSGDDLVYNEALKDWRSHNGVDFSAKIGDEVLSCADGVCEDVFDCEMGRCVVINHKDGFATMYANLDEDTVVKKGDKIARGDKIGRIGNTALGDITADEHLHFEIIKEGKNVNPVEYLD
jgi:murein DD-endopeptidase MepM/ murein hydrolase activator NlpD